MSIPHREPTAHHLGMRNLCLTPNETATHRTTPFEQILLVATIVLVPLEDHIPSVAGFSIVFIMFGLLAGYLLLWRTDMVTRTWTHPVFKASYAFLFVSCAIELLHPHSDFAVIWRIGQMVVGAVLVAALCRDRPALRAAIYGYLIAGVWLSVVLFLTSYGTLRLATATNFEEASTIRSEAFADSPLQVNLNRMALIAAQGAVVAFALTLTAGSLQHRIAFLGITLLCFVAAFLPLSRGGVVIAIVACASVLYAFGIRRGKTILIVGLIGASIAMWVPDAIWSRLTFSTEAREGDKVEGRAQVYTAAVKHFPDYAITGVGAGNFWSSWGYKSGFAKGFGVLGAHNCFFQVAIYWGLVGLLAYFAVVWQAYRYVPRHSAGDELALCLLGIAVSLLVFTQVAHLLYSKQFSLGLGMLVGARHWIWPNGIVPSRSGPERPFRRRTGYAR